MDEGICRGCGARIVWADKNGAKIPLDPKPACYRVSEDTERRLTKAYREHDVMVTHFATCPKASTFSKKVRTHG